MKKLFLFFFAITFLITQSCVNKNPVLTIDGGRITGVETSKDGVLIYKGIPYAAPPIGMLRWREPQPVISWKGVKSADKFGNAAIQNDQTFGGFYQHEFYQTGDPERSEDCLYLNIWTPAAGKADRKLPVAMYIHGGGFGFGYGHEKEFDGEAWAKRGVILVTINYRLGPLGFFSHPLLTEENPNHASGNQGLLDQIFALKWIKKNIAQFGGDPENITVFGQSAGGVAVGLLCVSPLAKDLISKAIIMSGGGVLVSGSSETGRKNYMRDDQDAAKDMFDYFGLTSLEQMRAYPAKDLLSLSGKFIAAMLARSGNTPGRVSPAGQVSASKYMKVNGYQSYNELMGPMTLKAEEAASKSLQSTHPLLKDTSQGIKRPAQTFRMVNTGPTIDGYSVMGVFTDEVLAGKLQKIPYMIGYVSNDVARLTRGIDKFCLINEEMGNKAYAYEFAREVPGDDAGAFHSGELWYIFNTLGRSWRPFSRADSLLSEKMVDCWTNFAKSGNPNGKGEQVWKPFTKNNRQIFVFNIEK